MKINCTNQFIYCILFLNMVLISSEVFAQKYQTGPQVLSFYSEVDDSEQPYALYLPKDYKNDKVYPLVVMLHGAGSNHRLALRRIFGKSNLEGENDVEASRYFPQWEDRDVVVAAPNVRGTMGYQGIAEKDVMDMLADVQSRFNIDKNRIYLTGLSMGGGGTLWLGLSYPDHWAAIAPVCPAPPEESKALASNALNIPVHIFQGGADPVVKPETVRAWVDAFKEEGVNAKYEEYPGVEHDSWVNAYQDGQVFDWFEQFERNPFPDQVRFKTDRYQHDKAYWIKMETIKPGILASIDARFKGGNQLTIETSELQSFTLNLEGHPKFDKNESIEINLDSQVFSTHGNSDITFSKKGGKWFLGKEKLAEQRKRKGLEGPMSEAISSRHVYVYGTGGNPSKETLEERKQQAEKAAYWSFYRGEFFGRIMIFPRVLSDQQVRDSDYESANLILFGDEKSNAVIAKLKDQLPMHLKADTKDYGLAYIFPQGKHYVLINSGLSIIDAPDQVVDWISLPPIVYALKSFEDFVLFSKEKILVNDRFDNTWQLPRSAQKELEASGVVVFP